MNLSIKALSKIGIFWSPKKCEGILKSKLLTPSSSVTWPLSISVPFVCGSPEQETVLEQCIVMEDST